MTTGLSNKRLMKEMIEISKSPPEGILLLESQDLKRWVVQLTGAKGTLYEGEVFKLSYTFTDSYPFDAPEVIFVETVPVHEHIYSNGHICLSILYEHWAPALTVGSISISILSMLSSAKVKKRPEGDERYSKYKKSSPKTSLWSFDGGE